MKKIVLSLAAMMLCINMFAINYTDKVTVTLYDGTYYPNLIIGESADLQEGTLVNGYYAPVNDLASMPLAVYVLYQGTEYENLIINNLQNFPIGIKTSNATEYSLYFGAIEGNTEILIYDNVADHMIHVNSESPYVFQIEDSQKNSIINDRFYINPASTGDPKICHEYGKLVVTDYVGDVVVSDMDGNEELRKSVMINASIDLSNLAAGQHRVAFNGQNLIIRVQ